MPAPITTSLATWLAQVERPGDFCAQGATTLPVFPLTVAGVGLVGLPLSPSVASELAAVATPAPYGRGEDTILDPTVRRCGQISAADITLGGPRWAQTFDTILTAAVRGLGAGSGVTAELYKLLVYEPGGFFLEHRDTEKARGMFGTLIVSLPCEHDGGTLHVHHNGRTHDIRLADPDLGLARWVAFYADCRHEIEPVLRGTRVVLVYSLIRHTVEHVYPPDSSAWSDALSVDLAAWRKETTPPGQLVYPLAHQYSLAELSFAGLKNEDAARAQVAVIAAERAGVELRLVMIEIVDEREVDNWAEDEDGEWHPYQDEDEDELDEEYLDEDRYEGALGRAEYAYAWRRPDDTVDPLPKRILHPTEFALRLSIRGTAPDATRVLEATGNEGSTQELRYHRAALVFWRPDADAALLARSPVEETLAYLSTELAAESTRGRARERIAGLVAAWADPGAIWIAPPSASVRLPFLRLLVQAGLPDSVRTYMVWLSASLRLDVRDEGALATWMKELPVEHHGLLFAAAIRGASSTDEADLLRRVAQGLAALPDRGREPVIEAVNTRLVGPEEDAGFRRRGSRWGRNARTFPAVLEIIGRFGTRTQKEVLVSNIREKLQEWPVETLLIPTLAHLVSGGAPLDPAWEPLREVCLGLLYARTAFPPEAPEDNRRSVDGLNCTCTHCVDVRAFLQSPTLLSWRLQAPIAARRHLEEEISRARAEVDCTTLKERTPHTLVLVKNKARFQQARIRYAEDLVLIRALGGEG